MRLKLAVIFATLVFACYGVAMGESMSLDHTDGLIDATHVMTDSPITFYIRMTNGAENLEGFTNGFRVYSPDNPAVNWTTLTADFTGTIGEDQFDMLWGIYYFGITGTGADTVGFVGSIMFQAGMAAGFDDITHTITIGNIGTEFTGSTICLDSSFYPPTNTWLWARATSGTIVPDWDGPHCYTIGEEGGDPPVITCPPDPLGFDLCGPEEVEIYVPISDATTVEVTGAAGAFWVNDTLRFTPATADTHSMHITATNADGTDECDVIAVVSFYAAVAIACPTEPFEVTIAEAGEVCVPLVVTNFASVTPDIGTWTSGQLCFTAATEDTYTITVDAVGTPPECNFTDQCIVTVIVTFDPIVLPEITCPTDPVEEAPCVSSGNLCADLPITNAVSVEITGDPSATWAAGQLCYDYDGPATLNLHVVATNADGTDECDVVININPIPIVAIDCPMGDPEVTIGGPGEACVPLPIVNNGTVSVEVGTGSGVFGSWADDVLCFNAPFEGIVPITVTAASTGPCPPDICEFDVIVSFTVNVEIDCPTEPISVEACNGDNICIPLAIVNATDVTVDGATWDADMLCFDVMGDATYNFHVIATNGETTDECDVTVNVTYIPLPDITCPSPGDFLICDGSEICVDVPVSNATEVLTTFGTWNDDVFCFTPDAGGSYFPVITASNGCGEVECTLDLTVTFYAAPTADFTPMPSEGPAPLTIEFTNLSTGEALIYTWDFGDGTVSSDFEPTHEFVGAGCYDVMLTVEDICGRIASATKTVCATASDTEIVVPSDRWMVVGCESATLNDVPLMAGDLVGARDVDGILCGLAEVDGAGGFVLTVYGNSPHTAYDEGPEPGEMVFFEINGEPVMSIPDVMWAWGDVLNICQFVIETENCISFDLDAGWHLISWNVNYTGSIEEFVGMMPGCVDVIMSFDMGGQTYDPLLLQFSTLQTVDYKHGYWVRLNCPAMFDICSDDPIGSGDHINIYTGWNLVSYWPNDILPVGDALASIWGMVEVVYGYDHGYYDYVAGGNPLYSTLTNMGPGFGYWIMSSGDGMLSYPSFGSPLARMVTPRNLPAIAGSRNWMSVYGENITIDGQAIADNSAIEIFTIAGVLIGSGEYTSGRLQFTSVYGYDTDEIGQAYPRSGDRLDLHVNGVSMPVQLNMGEHGSRIDLGYLAKGEALIPQTYRLAQNYPNPFNPTTTIAFSLPSNARVQLSIFNVLGQEVLTLMDAQMSAGEHEVVWNGDDASGRSVTSGVYFYRLTTDQFNETKKMILMK